MQPACGSKGGRGGRVLAAACHAARKHAAHGMKHTARITHLALGEHLIGGDARELQALRRVLQDVVALLRRELIGWQAAESGLDLGV